MFSSFSDDNCLIFDIGSDSIKVNFNDSFYNLPCYIGQKDYNYSFNRINNIFNYQSIWDDWDGFTDLLEFYLQNQLNSFSNNCKKWMFPINNFTSCVYKEKLTQIMFEYFNIDNISLPDSFPLCLYDNNETTGVSVDIGNSLVRVSSIYDGYSISNVYSKYGGNVITNLFNRMLLERSYNMNYTSVHYQYGKRIKERSSYIVTDYQEAIQRFSTLPKEWSKKFKLPNGQIIIAGSERFRASEILFNKEIESFETNIMIESCDTNILSLSTNLSNMIYNVIKHAEPSIQQKLSNTICLCGGVSNTPGLIERLTKDLDLLGLNNIRIIKPKDPTLSICKGAQKLLSMEGYGGKFHSKNDYDEYGPILGRSN